jgi:hypothetical protein
VAAAAIVRIELPELNEAGLKLAVMPAGNPAAERATVPVKPFSGVTEAVYVVLPPAAMVREAGAADSVKSGAGVATSDTEAECDSVPLVPVIVSG